VASAAVDWCWWLVIVVQVVARYAFGTGSIAMEELQWHLYAIGFMLGLSFTEMRERNVRIDVLAERFSQRTRLWIELLGRLLLFLPLHLFVLWFGGAVLLVVVPAQRGLAPRRAACPTAGSSSLSWSPPLPCWRWWAGPPHAGLGGAAGR
jgi:hypothetical protein